MFEAINYFTAHRRNHAVTLSFIGINEMYLKYYSIYSDQTRIKYQLRSVFEYLGMILHRYLIKY